MLQWRRVGRAAAASAAAITITTTTTTAAAVTDGVLLSPLQPCQFSALSSREIIETERGRRWREKGRARKGEEVEKEKERDCV